MLDSDFEQLIEETKVAFGCSLQERTDESPYHLLRWQDRYRFFVFLFPRLAEELEKKSQATSVRDFLNSGKRKILIEACMSRKKITTEKRRNWFKVSERDINSVLGLLYPKQYSAKEVLAAESRPEKTEQSKTPDPDDALINEPINDERNPELAEFLGYNRKEDE